MYGKDKQDTFSCGSNRNETAYIDCVVPTVGANVLKQCQDESGNLQGKPDADGSSFHLSRIQEP